MENDGKRHGKKGRRKSQKREKSRKQQEGDRSVVKGTEMSDVFDAPCTTREVSVDKGTEMSHVCGAPGTSRCRLHLYISHLFSLSHRPHSLIVFSLHMSLFRVIPRPFHFLLFSSILSSFAPPPSVNRFTRAFSYPLSPSRILHVISLRGILSLYARREFSFPLTHPFPFVPLTLVHCPLLMLTPPICPQTADHAPTKAHSILSSNPFVPFT